MVNNKKTVEFAFDFGSPTTYLAWTQLPSICADAGAELVYKPVLLGGIFKATGNASPVMVPAKGQHMLVDLERWAKHYDAPLHFNPHFPINTLHLMRAAVGVQQQQPEQFEHFVETVFTAMWVNGKNMGDAEVVVECLNAANLDATAILAMTQQPEVKAALIANTEAAVERGAFGAPTFFIGDQMYFGQDRLHFIQQALKGE